MKLRISALFTILLLMMIAPVNAQVDDNEVTFGEIITIEGEVREILSPYSFVLERSEPFDFTPADVVVINDDAEPFAVDINIGRNVQVTGVVDRLHMEDLNQEVTYDIDIGLFGDYTSEDYLLVATLVTDPSDLAIPGDFIFDPDTALQIETDPTPYLGEILTVEGYVSEILGPYSFRLEETEPFDLSPGEFLVFNDEEGPFEIDINLGRHVRVTGRLSTFNTDDFNAELEYEPAPDVFVNYTDEDYSMIAESVEAVGARTRDTAYHGDTNRISAPTMDDLEGNPLDYVGQTVTIRGEIVASYSNMDFLLEEDDFFDANPMQIPIFASEIVTDEDDMMDFIDDELYLVSGEVVAFNPLELEERLGFAPDPAVYGNFEELDIAIIATEVIQLSQE